MHDRRSWINIPGSYFWMTADGIKRVVATPTMIFTFGIRKGRIVGKSRLPTILFTLLTCQLKEPTSQTTFAAAVGQSSFSKAQREQLKIRRDFSP
jgi:hypothetical protein